MSLVKKWFCPKRKISPKPIDGKKSVSSLIDDTFLAYNASRLRESAQLFTNKYSSEETLVGASFAGALTPAGLGISTIVPLMENGLIDWVVATGANLYHDIHFACDMSLYSATPFVDDQKLRNEGIVRIYDILFEENVLLDCDALVREFCRKEHMQKTMSSAEFHNELGKFLLEKFPENQRKSVLMTAAKYDIPLYTSSPGDSTLGMDMAAIKMQGGSIAIDPSFDVTETASFVYKTKKEGKKSGVLLIGGGSPKNFILQTEPYIQEILALPGKGHNYFIQFTDARPDTGGLSGATPSEALSWGKIDKDDLPGARVCYGDFTILFPLFTAYIIEKGVKKKHKRLYRNIDEYVNVITEDFKKISKDNINY